MQNLIISKIVVQLLINYLFQNFAEWRKYGHWPVVLPFKCTQLLVQGEDLGVLPVAGELLLHDGQGDDVVQGPGNDWPSNLY